MIFVLLADGVIRLDEVVVSAQRDSVVIVADSVHSTDLRQSLLLQPSSMLRELGNRYVFSVRGLEDRQNTLYLEGVNLDNPVWGYSPTNVIYPALVSTFAIHPSDYSASLRLRDNPFLSVEAGTYGRGGVAFSKGSWGLGFLSDDNAYPYTDPFGRLYVRKNNYERVFNAFYRGDEVFFFTYAAGMGMPMRGYGEEGDDREVYGGVLIRAGRLRGSVQYYRYNEEVPALSYRLNYSGNPLLGMEGWGRRGRIHGAMEGDVLGWDALAGLSVSFDVSFLPLYRFQKVWGSGIPYVEVVIKDRLPSLSELYFEGPLATGNPDLSPEHFATIEAGFNGNLDEWWIKGDLFLTGVISPIFWTPTDSIWMPDNGDYLVLGGVELMGRSRYLGFSFSWIRNRLNGNMVLPYRPQVIYSFYFRIPLDAMEIRMDGTYYGSRPTYFSPSSQQLPPILLFNMHLLFNLDYGTFFVHLNNLLNRNWEFISGYPTEPFSVVVGFRREWR